MYFKADYDKLSEISRSALTECNNLNDAIADMIQICRDIEENWISEDSSIYIGRMKTYLYDAALEQDSLLQGAFTLNKIAVKYGAQDDKFESMVKRSNLINDNYFDKRSA